MLNIFKKWTKTWTFYHVLLWTGIIVSHAVDTSELIRYDPSRYVTNIIIRNGLLIALAYVNLFFLVPKLYRKGKIFAYYSGLVLSIILWVLLYNNFLFTYLPVFLRGEYEKNATFQFISNFFTACRYIVLSLLLLFMQDWFEQQKRLQQITIDKLAAELNYLRTRINPHFLFNTLNNIYGLALRKSDLTPQIVMKLSDMMEYMLYDNAARVTLKTEIDNIRNYIDLEKIRQTNINNINFEVKGNQTLQTIEPFLLFPFFENAFKHGISNNRGSGHLDALLEIEDREIRFMIENSKPEKKQENRGHGIGLSNLKERLSLLYPERHELSIVDSTNHFSVSLKLRQ